MYSLLQATVCSSLHFCLWTSAWIVTMHYCSVLGQTGDWAWSILLTAVGGLLIAPLCSMFFIFVLGVLHWVRQSSKESLFGLTLLIGIWYYLLALCGGIPYALFEARLAGARDYLDPARAVAMDCNGSAAQPRPDEVHWVTFGKDWSDWAIDTGRPWRQKVYTAYVKHHDDDGNVVSEGWANHCIVRILYKGSNQSSVCAKYQLWATCFSEGSRIVASCGHEELTACDFYLAPYEVRMRTFNNRETNYNQGVGEWAKATLLLGNTTTNNGSVPLPLEYNSVGTDKFYMEQTALEEAIGLDLLCCAVLFGVPMFISTLLVHMMTVN